MHCKYIDLPVGLPAVGGQVSFFTNEILFLKSIFVGRRKFEAGSDRLPTSHFGLLASGQKETISVLESAIGGLVRQLADIVSTNDCDL